MTRASLLLMDVLLSAQNMVYYHAHLRARLRLLHSINLILLNHKAIAGEGEYRTLATIVGKLKQGVVENSHATDAGMLEYHAFMETVNATKTASKASQYTYKDDV